MSRELQRLDAAKDSCIDQINATFQQVQAMVDKRKQEIIEAVNAACSEKRKVLEEQHSLIESEKTKVRYRKFYFMRVRRSVRFLRLCFMRVAR